MSLVVGRSHVRPGALAPLLVVALVLAHCAAPEPEGEPGGEGGPASGATAPEGAPSGAGGGAGGPLADGAAPALGDGADAASPGDPVADGGADGSVVRVPLEPELDAAALAWVSKARCLPCTFDARLADLVAVDASANLAAGGTFRVRRFVRAPLRALVVAASRPGDALVVTSAYRSYATQADTLAGWVAQDGPCEAARASAAPGRSEHQLGVTVDVGSSLHGRLEAFARSPLAAWVRDHAHEHGFVVSYPHPDPATNERLTGYTYEPWHLRYVGVTLATAMRTAAVQRGVPVSLEEVFGKKIPALLPYVPATADAPAACVACDPARGQLSGCPVASPALTPEFACRQSTRVRCVLGLITCETCAGGCASRPGDDVCL